MVPTDSCTKLSCTRVDWGSVVEYQSLYLQEVVTVCRLKATRSLDMQTPFESPRHQMLAGLCITLSDYNQSVLHKL